MVLDVLHKTSDTLATLHQNYNFVHADLHHDNLMVEVGDNYQCIGIKIFDFDLSYATERISKYKIRSFTRIFWVGNSVINYY